MALNRYECIGRVGSLKLTYLSDGKPAMEMSVAVDESYRNREGEKVEKCEWVKVKAFEKQAEFIDKWCRVGKLVYVAGKLATRTWEKDGQKNYATEIQVNAPGMGVTPLEWPEKDEQRGGTGAQGNPNPSHAHNPRSSAQTRSGGNCGGKGEDQGPAFPSEASGMDDVPF